MNDPLSNFELHELDQCEAAIQNGLKRFAEMPDEEFFITLAMLEHKGIADFGDDWPAVRDMLLATRRKP